MICSIALKILVAMVTTFENTSLAMAKLAIFWQNFQLQSCLKFDFTQLHNWKFCRLAVAREVFSKVVTIATKILQAIEQIIANLYIYDFLIN